MTGKTIKCSNCNASLEIPDGINKVFCLYCGTQNLLTEVLEIPGLTLLCLKCNTKNKEENIYCDNCAVMLQYYCKFCSELHPFSKKVCPKTGKKFDVNTTCDKEGKPALHKAIENNHTDTIKLLLSLGTDINLRDNNGNTPLHWASVWQHIDIVKLLISNGADINIKNNGGRTPLNSVVINGLIDMAKLLLSYKGIDINIKENEGWSPLSLATEKNHKDMVKLLLSNGADINIKNNEGWSPLGLATEKNHKDMVKLLLSNGADINIKNNARWSPLGLATAKNYKDIVELLLSHGADVNAEYALSCALRGDLDITKLLIEHGADVNAKDDHGTTPLIWAIEHDNMELIKLLISHGADINAKGYLGYTPLHKVLSGKVSDLDNRYLSYEERCRRYEYYNIIAELLIEQGADVNAKTDHGFTPLSWAISYGDYDHRNSPIIELLISHGADVNAKDYHNCSLLHEAIIRKRINFAELLIKHGADVNAKTENGDTPLLMAIKDDNYDYLDSMEPIIELLISHGADVNAKNKYGYTPWAIVSTYKCAKRERLLNIIKSKSPGLCFITTATCLSLNKSDDCYELNTFRRFRDEWLLKNKEGQELIKEYYQIAPEIVNKINELPNKEEIYKDIWRSYLSRCLNLIETGNFEEVKALYIELVRIYFNKFFYKRSF